MKYFQSHIISHTYKDSLKCDKILLQYLRNFKNHENQAVKSSLHRITRPPAMQFLPWDIQPQADRGSYTV